MKILLDDNLSEKKTIYTEYIFCRVTYDLTRHLSTCHNGMGVILSSHICVVFFKLVIRRRLLSVKGQRAHVTMSTGTRGNAGHTSHNGYFWLLGRDDGDGCIEF